VCSKTWTARGERIAVVLLDGSPPRLFPNVTIPAERSGDDKGLFYLAARDGGTNVWRQPIAGRPAAPLRRFSAERIFRFSASPDLQRWAIAATSPRMSSSCPRESERTLMHGRIGPPEGLACLIPLEEVWTQEPARARAGSYSQVSLLRGVGG
jgi:hypothetical protein